MWLSRHIYYGRDSYGSEIDQLLVRAVGPLVEELLASGAIRRYFFIRYSAGGSHLRLRLQLTSEDLGAAVSERVQQAVDAFAVPGEDGERHLAGPLVQPQVYQPEAARYGGEVALEVAEELFFRSSQMALGLLADCQGERGARRRLGRSLLLALVLARTFFAPAAAKVFLWRYSEAYLRMVQKTAPRPAAVRAALRPERVRPGALDAAVDSLLFSLEDAGGLPRLGVPMLDRWHEVCRAARSRLLDLADRRRLDLRAAAGLDSVVGSYLHVHHNRLGLNIPQEVHLTHLAAAALGRRGEEP